MVLDFDYDFLTYNNDSIDDDDDDTDNNNNNNHSSYDNDISPSLFLE